MSDIQKQIQEINDRLLLLQKTRDDAEKSANAHEEQARADRRTMSECKVEMAQLSQSLRHAGVVKATEDSAFAAQQAAKEASTLRDELAKSKEAHDAEHQTAMAKLTKQQAKVDAMLAKLTEAKPE